MNKWISINYYSSNKWISINSRKLLKMNKWISINSKNGRFWSKKCKECKEKMKKFNLFVLLYASKNIYKTIWGYKCNFLISLYTSLHMLVAGPFLHILN